MTPVKATAHPKLFAIFPGQGSQHLGMGKELYESFSLARETFEESSDAIGRDLKKLCFDGPDSDLTLTENTQPCLLTTSVAAFRVASAELGFVPGAVAGHSLGEYSALVAAGVLPLASAAAWVHERGKSMQTAVPVGQGAMAAVLNLDDRIEKLCEAATQAAKDARAKGGKGLDVEPIVEPANFNAPGQVVIAGSADGIEAAVALIKAGGDFAGGKAIPLQVSAPFHCRLMKPARSRMAELFAAAKSEEKPKTPAIPYFPNRTARETREAGLVFELLVDQVDHPVLWKQAFAAALESGRDFAVEFGPGKVLQGLGKRIAAGKPCQLAGVSDVTSLKALEPLLKQHGGAK